MTGPIVIVDSAEIREGQLDRLRATGPELVAFVRANEPRVIAFAFFLDEDATRATVVQVHPDAASIEFHLSVTGSAFAGFGELIGPPLVMDIYGSPGPELLERLRARVDTIGNGTVAVHDLLAGFARLGASGAAAPE